MQKIYLAANYITNTESVKIIDWLPDYIPDEFEDSGHLQLVYDDGGGPLREIEVRIPNPLFIFGNWKYFYGDDHARDDDLTDYVDSNDEGTDPDRYKRVELVPCYDL